MNGFNDRSSCGRRLGDALRSGTGGPRFVTVSSPAPSPRLIHADTPVDTHAPGLERSVNATRAYKPARVGARLPARTPGDSRVEDRGHEEGAGPVPDVNAWRRRCAGGGRHPSTLAPWCLCPLLHPLALPSPQLGTPLHRLSPKLGLSLASSPAAPRSLRERCVPPSPPQAAWK